MEYPRKYDIIFHLGLPQEYAYSNSPRRREGCERGRYEEEAVGLNLDEGYSDLRVNPRASSGLTRVSRLKVLCSY